MADNGRYPMADKGCYIYGRHLTLRADFLDDGEEEACRRMRAWAQEVLLTASDLDGAWWDLMQLEDTLNAYGHALEVMTGGLAVFPTTDDESTEAGFVRAA